MNNSTRASEQGSYRLASTREEEPLLRDSKPDQFSTRSRVSNLSTGVVTSVGSTGSYRGRFLNIISDRWLPAKWETDPNEENNDDPSERRGRIVKEPRMKQYRSVKRRLFLFMNEPDSSIASAIFFAIMVIAISGMNVVMIMQTMTQWQYQPDDCRSCGGPVSHLWDDDDSIIDPGDGVQCECPPSPLPWTEHCLRLMVYFFTVEWILRVLFFEPALQDQAPTFWGRCGQWLSFATSIGNIVDAVSIFPYYVEMSFQTNGFMSLRLFRLFRVLQLVRLGQYNEAFVSLSNVLALSISYLKLLVGVLFFGAALFGSMMYWLEKGDWQYWEETGNYQFVREDELGNKEISPFTSIPASFWWFAVTSTTVGYGDMVPVTTGGKLVATLAMLTGVLVIAFPVSVFSDLWQSELRKTRTFAGLMDDDDDDDEAATTTNGKLYDHPEGLMESSESIPQHATASLADRTTMDDFYGTADKVVMSKDDFGAIVSHYQSIQDSQKQIRAILRKYKPHHTKAGQNNKDALNS